MISNSTFVGGSKSVLKATGRRKGLTELVASAKWEFGSKTYYRRSWKSYRASQYKDHAPTIKNLELLEPVEA